MAPVGADTSAPTGAMDSAACQRDRLVGASCPGPSST